jgi:uncharacterized BrkB/YihY/UPF0761 family membrane protein
MVILEMSPLARWVLVIFLFIFTYLLAIMVVGTIAQRLNIDRKASSKKQVGIIVIVIATTIYLAVVFLFLYDFALDYLNLN